MSSDAVDSPPFDGHIYTYNRDLNGWVRKQSTSTISSVSPSSSSSSVSSYHTSTSTAACSPASSTTTVSSVGLARSSPESARQGSGNRPTAQQKDGQDVSGASGQRTPSKSYTRPINLNIHGGGSTFRVISTRETRGASVTSTTSRPTRQRSVSSTCSTSSSSRRNRLPGIGAHGYPFFCHPNNGTPANTPECSPGPNPFDLPHPIPDIIITDFSMLSSASDRYTASPLSDLQVRPYHNVTDPTFLGRYSGRGTPGYKSPKCGGTGHEIVDGVRFGRMGGQKSVIALARRISQLREVESGCPSGCCGCRGRGVAMAACGDLEEEEDDGEEGEGSAIFGESSSTSLRSGRLQKMPYTDRISEAREMRARVNGRKLSRQLQTKSDANDCKSSSRGSPVQKEGETTMRTPAVRTRTVRRKTSRFTEIGCTLGDDSVENLSPATAYSSSSGTGSRDKPEAKPQSAKGSKKVVRTLAQRASKKPWVRRILQL